MCAFAIRLHARHECRDAIEDPRGVDGHAPVVIVERGRAEHRAHANARVVDEQMHAAEPALGFVGQPYPAGTVRDVVPDRKHARLVREERERCVDLAVIDVADDHLHAAS